MGNVFDGGTESFLLACIPSLSLAMAIGFLAFRVVLGRRIARHAESWPAEPAPREDERVQYRTPAVALGPHRLPRRVRWLANVTFVWGAGIAAFWLLACIALVVAHGTVPLAACALFAAILGGRCGVHLLRAALSLTHRTPSVLPHIVRARTWLRIHHVTVFLLGTGLLFLFVLSNQFFWNAVSDTRAAQLVEFAWIYGLVVLLPSALGALLSHQLGRIERVYQAAA